MTEYHNPIIYLDTTESTNLFAQEFLKNHEPLHGTVISAGQQLQGRGQRGNQWLSVPGLNLTFSIILFPSKFNVSRHFELNMVFSLGICDYLSAKRVDQFQVKWPNDILVNGNKIAGILLENTIRGELIHTVIAGIGININQVDFIGNYTIEPTSLKRILGITIELKEALPEVLNFIWKRYDQMINQEVELLRKDYHALLYKLNEPCRFTIDNLTWTGLIRGVNQDGQLLIENENGEIKQHPITGIKMLV